MSVTISIAPTSDDTWMIRNAVYRWLVARVAELHADQPDVIERLTVCGHFGGISLETERRDSRDLTDRIVAALCSTVDHIRTKDIPLTDDSGSPWPELQSQVHDSLDELRHLLSRFPAATDS